MDGNMNAGNEPIPGMPRLLQNMPPPDDEVLDAIRELEDQFPEGLYSAEILGITEEPEDPDNPIPSISAEERLQQIRAAVEYISHNLTGSLWPCILQYAAFSGGNQGNSYVSNDGTISNPIVVDDECLLEHTYADEDDASFNPENAHGVELSEQAYASNDGAVVASDDIDDVEHSELFDIDPASNPGALDDSFTSAYGEESGDEKSVKYEDNDDGPIRVYGTQSPYGYYAENVSLPHDPEPVDDEEAELSAESDDDGSDYSEHRPSKKTIKSRKNIVKPPKKTVKPVEKAVKSPPTAVKSPPMDVRPSSMPGDAPAKASQVSNENTQSLSSHLALGDYFYGSTRLLAKKIAAGETNNQTSLGKRSRNTAPSANPARSDNANDVDEDESDSIPIAKKAKVQKRSRDINHMTGSSNGTSQPNPGRQATSAPSLYSLDTPVSPKMKPSLSSKTLSSRKGAFGEKTLIDQNRSFTEKRLPNARGSVTGKTLPGGKSTFGDKTRPESEVSGAASPPATIRQYGGKTLSRHLSLYDDEELVGPENPTVAKQPIVPKKGRRGKKEKKEKKGAAAKDSAAGGKRSWDEKEHDAIEAELRRLRSEEENDGLTGKSGLRDEKLWGYISRVLQERHNVKRSLAGCKYYWGRFGREKSGFDERAIKDEKKLSTSVQHKKKG